MHAELTEFSPLHYYSVDTPAASVYIHIIAGAIKLPIKKENRIEMKATVLIHQKAQSGDDVIAWAFDRTHKGIVTTDHAASIYGQPVVIGEDGKLWDYPDIKGITYYGQVAAEDVEAMQQLKVFGIEVVAKNEVIYE